MPNRNYLNGYAKELRIKHKLESEGWFVIRSSGSHSPVDLVAFMGVEVSSPSETTERMLQRLKEPFKVDKLLMRFIQCKPKGGYLTPQERIGKEALERRLGITIEVL